MNLYVYFCIPTKVVTITSSNFHVAKYSFLPRQKENKEKLFTQETLWRVSLKFIFKNKTKLTKKYQNRKKRWKNMSIVEKKNFWRLFEASQFSVINTRKEYKERDTVANAR